MNILDRLVIRQFFRLFFTFMLASPVLFVLGDLTDNLDTYLDRGFSTGQVVMGYVYQMPLFLSWGLPIAALIATIFTVSNMTRHSEVAAAKAGGISFYRLFAALPLIGVILTLVGLGLTELVPVGNQLRAQRMGEQGATQVIRSDFIYHDLDGRIFAVRRLDVRDAEISGITVEREGDEPEVPSVHVSADRATYADSTGWTLQNGVFRLMAGPDIERAVRFGSLRTRGFTESPDQLLDRQKDPDQMRYAELGRLIQVLRRSGGQPLDLMVERSQKIAIPVAALVIVLFGAPLANSSPRSGAAHGVGVSLGITILYLMLFKVSGAAGTSGALPPVVAAWLPNAVFMIAAAVLIGRVRT